MVSSRADCSISPDGNDVVKERAPVAGEGIPLIRASNAAVLLVIAVHMSLRKTRRIPTANPGREARAALQIIRVICAMRCLLIGPKILEAHVAIGREKSRFWIASRSKAVAASCFLSLGESAILPT